MSHPGSSLNPQYWAPSSLEYRDSLQAPTSAGHPSPQVLSPELSPHLHHSSHSSSPTRQDQHSLFPRQSPVNSRSGSGPGPTTWENMQQRHQQEAEFQNQQRLSSYQQRHHLDSARHGHNASPSEMLQGVVLSGPVIHNVGMQSHEELYRSDDGHRHQQHAVPNQRGRLLDRGFNHNPTYEPSPCASTEHYSGNNVYQEQPQLDTRNGRGSGLRLEGSMDRGSRQASRRRSYEDGRLGILPPDQPRSYSAIKLVGDGSFGTVWLCDWKSELAPSTVLSAMQCGAGARPEWTGKRLVAVKRMKRVWEGGWQQASKLGELVSLRDIPQHPAIIPLYDAFLQPDTKELYFVFECMEGNLYQLTKSRKGRHLASGLIASVFRQVAEGLHHIHQYGYFHRDLKPENLLVTTTGLQSYLPVVDPEDVAMDQALVNAGRQPPERPTPQVEKDVTVIVKLADFGLARSLESKPPYTEYVSTRWYRAPEVLLRSKDYSAPVDMWALGTILAELLNLKALFPGQSEIDQCWRINDILGDPSAEYGHDERGLRRGGGEWNRGLKLAKNVGYGFPKKIPIVFASLFSPKVPISLIDCIRQLLRYNPKHRLTSEECLNHPYFALVAPHLQANADLPQIPFGRGQPARAELDMILQRLEQQRLQRLHEARISSIPTRSAPPPAISSNSPAYEKPAFSMGSESIRTLPPPVASPHTMSHNRSYHPSPERPSRYNSPVGASNSTSTSQTLLPSLSHNNGASALVESLRELDLPTADLSTYGHRSLSPGQHNKRPAPVPHQHGERRSSDLVALQSMSLATPEHGSQSSLNQSNSGHNTYPQAPPAAPTYQRSYLPPHMSTPTALMSGQTPRTPGSFDLYHHRGSGESLLPPAEETDVDMQDVSEPLPMAPSNKFIPHPYQPQPPREPPQQAVNSRLGDLAATGKKKKWGLSSVFGVGGNSHNESKADHGPPPAANIASSALNNASLKRPQSEVASADRSAVTQVNLNPGMDSKKNRKELDKQAKEQEKQLQAARRKAMEDAQKERARAVLAKRTQLVETRRVNGTQTNEIEWNTELSTIDSASMRTSNTSNTSIPAGHKSQSQQELMSRASSTPSNIGNLPSTSTPDLIPNQDLERRHREDSNPDAYRSKSRKMSAGDDHSLSGQAYRNTSSLTVGTTDSDPGPPRTHHVYQRPVSRFGSTSSFARSSSSFARSTASVDRQLAQDFRAHASVNPGLSSSYMAGPGSSSAIASASASGSNSSLSLGRYASSVSLSGPTTPYSHPYGQAVAAGNGIGRNQVLAHGQFLPSIQDISKDWENGQDVHLDAASALVRNHPSGPSDGSMSLPPFAQIASLADSQPKGK